MTNKARLAEIARLKRLIKKLLRRGEAVYLEKSIRSEGKLV